MPLLEGRPTNLAGQQVRLTFLHTTDIHSRLLPYDFSPLATDVDLGLIPEAGPFGGVARLGALIARERANSERVLHLDSGDSFQGAPIFNVNSGEVEYKFLSRVRLDAAVIGNHEFDAGALNFTTQLKNQATFPVLAANFAWDDYRQLDSNQTQLYTEPYTIKDMGGVRVGIVGMANISSLNSLVEGGNSLQATPLEQNEAARAYVELLKPVTDLVVVVSHAGLTEDQDLVQGYEAFYEYGKIQQYLNRDANRWEILEWFGTIYDPKSVVRVKIPGVSGIDLILGGHLHIVLNPPQLLTDPTGRKVILSHGGAFSKYLARMDLVVQMPQERGGEQAEVISHSYRVFPVDSLWCSDAMHDYYKAKFWPVGAFIRDPQVRAAINECTKQESKDVTQLLQPYIVDLDFKLSLTSLFGYAPRDIARRNNSSGGDSPLGNIAADSMRKRRRVEAEVAVTNSLGIRDNLYAGLLTQEAMFNVFPFENTINIMYLSGSEMQEMFDFISERSATRGCISQAQVSGVRFTMDCAQAQLNLLRLACDPKKAVEKDKSHPDCPQDDRTGRAVWQCLDDVTGGRCWAHPGTNVVINGSPIDPYATYRVAVNDYIARGGSGFVVLKRNTTRIETGIPLRDSLIGYLQSFCTCDDLLAAKLDAMGNMVGSNGQRCGALLDGKWQVDSQEISYCKTTSTYQDALKMPRPGDCTCQQAFRGEGACRLKHSDAVAECVAMVPPGPALGKCSCREALAGDVVCGNVTSQERAFCENPTRLAVAVGVEDGRIVRRVK
ncbi:MAG: bifunctional metallophosphatase/5'-nucleotidase [Myxococcaceae bacterium]|nr:bifunctional metallophosphatase/5'-nucleotidase [Myxococcaceae bacterium]